MLDSIIIKNVATYDVQGIQITDLKKINFFYGANGSGKTTITKFIGDPLRDPFKDCSLSWKSGLPIKSLVYNKEFREKNFGKGNIDGVFTLGQATKEQIEAIAEMKEEQTQLKNSQTKKKETLEKQENERALYESNFREEVWSTVYKKYEGVFKEAFAGVMRKETFSARLLTEYDSNKSSLLSLDEIKEKSLTIFGKRPELISLFKDLEFNRILEIENDPIWKKKIIGKADVPIADLIQKLNINDWVNEGRAHIEQGQTCPFCQEETITESFKQQLESYFDQEFTTDVSLVSKLSGDYRLIAENLLSLLQQIESSEKAKESSKLDISGFSMILKALSSQIISNRELINAKAKEPSRAIDLIPLKEQLDAIQNLILIANVAIGRHNEIVSNYNSERESLIKMVWKFLIEEHKLKIETYKTKIKGLEAGIQALKIQLEEIKEKAVVLKSNIQSANKNVTSVQPSVDEINRILKSYGFLNFEIVPAQASKNQYQIQREDGSIADSTLSEGEVTFITFLYFLQLAKGSTIQETITDDRILVVDDPISSLDSNVLFVVSSLLKEIIKAIKKDEGNIKQILLFTHNVYFHKEASFIDGRTKTNNDTFYWIIRKNSKISSLQPFGKANPIQSSYELLWQELRNRDNNSGITVQNTMRRIIENYFKILGKYGDDELIGKFQDIQEQEICRSLICWINDGSHGITDDLFVERQEGTIERYLLVFKRIFEETKHSEHYKMMMGETEISNV